MGFAGGKLFIAENYPEAVGIMTALRNGAALLAEAANKIKNQNAKIKDAEATLKRGGLFEESVRCLQKAAVGM